MYARCCCGGSYELCGARRFWLMDSDDATRENSDEFTFWHNSDSFLVEVIFCLPKKSGYINDYAPFRLFVNEMVSHLNSFVNYSGLVCLN